MTDELKTAIENLYSSFSVYPSKSIMESYICCVSYADKESRTTNKPIAYMAVDANPLTPVLRKNVSDYSKRMAYDTATNAIAKTLGIIQRRSDVEKYFFNKIWISQ